MTHPLAQKAATEILRGTTGDCVRHHSPVPGLKNTWAWQYRRKEDVQAIIHTTAVAPLIEAGGGLENCLQTIMPKKATVTYCEVMLTAEDVALVRKALSHWRKVKGDEPIKDHAKEMQEARTLILTIRHDREPDGQTCYDNCLGCKAQAWMERNKEGEG